MQSAVTERSIKKIKRIFKEFILKRKFIFIELVHVYGMQWGADPPPTKIYPKKLESPPKKKP